MSKSGINGDVAKIPNGFPAKLHRMLTDIEEGRNGFKNAICWSASGRSFMVQNKKDFIANVMPK